MKDKYNDNSESGLTLVEILAGIVILALMILTIAVVFTQTARTNKASENILDATYVAQTELEHINNISKETNPELRDTEGYQQQPNEADWQIFHKQINNTNYFVEIRLKDADTSEPDEAMKRVVVKVYDKNDTAKSKPKAQMESLLTWGEMDETTP